MNLNNSLQSNRVASLLIYPFLFVICFLVYFNALHNEFIFDDNYLIVENIYIKNIFFLPKLFKTDIFHFEHPEIAYREGYYRPLLAISCFIDYSIWKLKPLGYRLTNIIIQSLNSFLVFMLISLIFKDTLLAFLTAVLFCIHPIQVSSVAFISGRANLLDALFMLLSLITFISYVIYQKKWYFVLSLLSFIFALLSREWSILLPCFILIYAAFSGINKKKVSIYLIPYIFIDIFYIWWRIKFLPSDRLYLTGIFSIRNIEWFIYYLGEYFRQFILPFGLQMGLFGSNAFFRFALFVTSFIVMAYLLIKAIIHKERITIFSLLFYFIGLLPVIKLKDTIYVFGPVLSEHYTYMASIGFFSIYCLSAS